jgi:hypothetical protein
MKFWHGTADTLVPLADLTAFQSALTALGTTPQIIQVSGAGHLNQAALWDGPTIAAFLQANQ